MTDKNKDHMDEMVTRTAQVSVQIRKAMRAAIPAPPEQFLTLMIPGKVVDFKRFTHGINEATGEPTAQVTPDSVQLQEAILCDDMPAVSAIQLGPTGRSVARSYSAALSKFYPEGSTTGVSDGTPHEHLSPAEKRYKAAMDWLTDRDSNEGHKTRIDIYREKQEKYTAAFERKAMVFSDALSRAIAENPRKTPQEQRDIYDKWVGEHRKTYNNLVQAAYMDWVTMGKKEEVEYYFSIVDNDSAMSRVEASKECMRNSVIGTPDGAAEYQKVILEPANWAWLAGQKIKDGPVSDTVESLTFKISRLQKLNILLESMKENEKFIVKGDTSAGSAKTPAEGENAPVLSDKQKDVAKAYFEAQSKYRETYASYENAVKAEKPDEKEVQRLKKELGEEHGILNTAQNNFSQCLKEVEKDHVDSLTKDAEKAQRDLFASDTSQIAKQIQNNLAEIAGLKKLRDQLSDQKKAKPGSTKEAVELLDGYGDQVGIPRAPAQPATDARPDYWTSVYVDVASSHSSDTTKTDASSLTVDASVHYGLASVAASVSHNESHREAMKQMSNANVKINFDCMRVDITRPWLRGELFYDHDLRIPDDDPISPGPLKLTELMDPSNPSDNQEEREKQKELYDLFPMYPTAFLLAANVVLEITGETSAIQSYLSDSSTSASASVSYGPFSASGSGAQAKSKSDSSCESTATGCKITIKSPQIIGWISQILPTLPRPSKTKAAARV